MYTYIHLIYSFKNSYTIATKETHLPRVKKSTLHVQRLLCRDDIETDRLESKITSIKLNIEELDNRILRARMDLETSRAITEYGKRELQLHQDILDIDYDTILPTRMDSKSGRAIPEYGCDLNTLCKEKELQTQLKITIRDLTKEISQPNSEMASLLVRKNNILAKEVNLIIYVSHTLISSPYPPLVLFLFPPFTLAHRSIGLILVGQVNFAQSFPELNLNKNTIDGLLH